MAEMKTTVRGKGPRPTSDTLILFFIPYSYWDKREWAITGTLGKQCHFSCSDFDVQMPITRVHE